MSALIQRSFTMNWKSGAIFLLGAALVAGAVLMINREPVQGQGGKGAGTYSVVATDGAHLIVTDNAASKLYFYAIDKGGKVGDDLKLRGTVDLREVGKASIKPIDAKPQN
jgi:hypothetical protein